MSALIQRTQSNREIPVASRVSCILVPPMFFDGRIWGALPAIVGRFATVIEVPPVAPEPEGGRSPEDQLHDAIVKAASESVGRVIVVSAINAAQAVSAALETTPGGLLLMVPAPERFDPVELTAEDLELQAAAERRLDELLPVFESVDWMRSLPEAPAGERLAEYVTALMNFFPDQVGTENENLIRKLLEDQVVQMVGLLARQGRPPRLFPRANPLGGPAFPMRVSRVGARDCRNVAANPPGVRGQSASQDHHPCRSYGPSVARRAPLGR